MEARISSAGKYPMPTAPCADQPVRERDVPGSIGHLGRKVDALLDTVNQIVQRLQPVSRASGPQGANEKCKPVECKSPLADEIDRISQRVGEATDNLRDQIEKLEL